jgi:hypothetical protein
MRRKTKIIAVRVTEEDWSLIKKICMNNGTWSGSWARAIILQELFKMGRRPNTDPYIRDKAQ